MSFREDVTDRMAEKQEFYNTVLPDPNEEVSHESVVICEKATLESANCEY